MLHGFTGVALDVWSYSGLIKGFVQNNELQAALEVLQEMKDANNITPNEVCFLASRFQLCAMAGIIEARFGHVGLFLEILFLYRFGYLICPHSLVQVV